MKKIIDKNGRLFGVISIIDVAVLLVVAVMALALYVRGNRSVTGTTLSDELSPSRWSLTMCTLSARDGLSVVRAKKCA